MSHADMICMGDDNRCSDDNWQLTLAVSNTFVALIMLRQTASYFNHAVIWQTLYTWTVGYSLYCLVLAIAS